MLTVFGLHVQITVPAGAYEAAVLRSFNSTDAAAMAALTAALRAADPVVFGATALVKGSLSAVVGKAADADEDEGAIGQLRKFAKELVAGVCGLLLLCILCCCKGRSSPSSVQQQQQLREIEMQEQHARQQQGNGGGYAYSGHDRHATQNPIQYT